MKAIVNNIKNMWNVCGNVVKRELNEFELGWAEAEEYWKEHPEARPEPFMPYL